MQYYNKSQEYTLTSLNVKEKQGLTNTEVEKRRAIYGKNIITSKKKIKPLIIFLRQFKNFIVYILLFALIVSFLTKDYKDSAVIAVILIFNAFFGFFQEYKAEKAIEALKKYSALKSKVLRNGKIVFIDSSEIVPGDIIILEEGDKVPADARVIESNNLQLLESSLTGESTAVSKVINSLKTNLSIADQKNMVFSGTLVTKGRGKAVVTDTAMKTQIGKIADSLSEVKDKQTPLQRKLASFGKWVGIAVIIIAILIFIVGVSKEGAWSLLFQGNYTDFLIASKVWLLTALAIAVAAVPEGLPAIVTISLALGVRKMVKTNTLVRRLPAVETLGSTTIICSDKTGTLTRNEMTVRKAYINLKEYEISGSGYQLEGKITNNGKDLPTKEAFIFRIGALCNNSFLQEDAKQIEMKGDPTEAALLVSAEKAGMDTKSLDKNWKRVGEIPFDSQRKMMSTINKNLKSGKEYVFSKGAPEVILNRCSKILIAGKAIPLTEKTKKQILNKNEEFAKNSLRVLAFAYKEKKGELEEKLIFVGLQAMIDPPRDNVKSSIKKCNDAGIRVIMITGDNRHTAEAIAKEIGIKGKSMNGLDFINLSQKEKIKTIKEVSIFSRVEPTHKLEIVKLLQEQGHIVAMTGDGVNDAPALKIADIGIAMGIKGTEVAKESSDMILQDDDFTSIVESVEEGRGIYENIRKFINYLLSSNLAEVMIIVIAILLSMPLPLTALMLLWTNLITDGLPALSLSLDPKPKGLMDKPPRKPEENILNKKALISLFYVSAIITIGVLAVFYWGIIAYAGLDELNYMQKIQTLAFTALIVMEFVRLQTVRSEYKIGMFSNKYLVAAVIASIGLQLLLIYTPMREFFGATTLNITDWAVILGVSLVVLILNLAFLKIKKKIPYLKE